MNQIVWKGEDRVNREFRGKNVSADGRVIVTIGEQGDGTGNNKQTNQCGHIAVSDRIFPLLCSSRLLGAVPSVEERRGEVSKRLRRGFGEERKREREERGIWAVRNARREHSECKERWYLRQRGRGSADRIESLSGGFFGSCTK